MLIKSIDDKTKSFREIESLLPFAEGRKSRALLHELTTLKKGYYNEKQVAYLIDHAYGERQNTLVLHDLRLEHGGLSAQIDHLLINPGAIYILESKYFSQKLHIDIHGNWIARYDHAEYAIPSPIEQNRRHIRVLRKILEDYELIPSRLGYKVELNFFDFVLISTNCIIEGEIPPNVIKADTVETSIRHKWDSECDRYLWLNSFKLAANLITHNEMRRIAEKLLQLHKPLMIDYAAKFGISPKPPADTALLQKLRTLRADLAKTHRIAPQRIFDDETLADLARYKPKNPAEIMKTTKTEKPEFRRYGYKFLNTILEYESQPA